MITVSAFISAVATVFIALYVRRSHQLAQEIKRSNEQKTGRDEEFRQQVSHLYQAIVIATLLSGPSGRGQYIEAKKLFESQYNGETPIFKPKA